MEYARFRGGGWWKCHDDYDVSSLAEYCQKGKKKLYILVRWKKPFWGAIGQLGFLTKQNAQQTGQS